MRRACEKRPVPLAVLERTGDQLERMLVESGEREIESRRVGEWVMDRLREIDGVAYVRLRLRVPRVQGRRRVLRGVALDARTPRIAMPADMTCGPEPGASSRAGADG